MRKKLFMLSLVLMLAGGATLQAQTNVSLSDLNLSLMTSGYGRPKPNRSIDGNPLTLAGKTYANGIGTHADSKLSLALGGKAKRFTALVGVDDEATRTGSVVFTVTADGKELYRSKMMRPGDKPAKINVTLKGVNRLELQALSADDGISNDHADWVDAYIEMNQGRPTAISDHRMIEIATDNVLLALTIDKENNLMQQYLGKRGDAEVIFARGERKDQAYPTIQSSSNFVYWGEPALHVIHADGHTSTMLKYEKHETKQEAPGVHLTRITLKDEYYPLYADVCYRTYTRENVVEQWTEVYHHEPHAIIIKQAASAALTLRGRNYHLTQFTGDWMNEFNVDEYPLTVGSKVIENKWGITGSNGRQPHFMVSVDKQATETQGEVLAGTLAWSGNFSLKFERATYGQLTTVAGINPWAADYQLPTNHRYTTPALIYTYSTTGKGQASRNLHRWAINHGIRDGQTPLRTIFNNWEATGMNTSDERITPFLQPAKDLGFELFLLDDGWFGLPDKARVLGEWNPTPLMHPQGMGTLIGQAGKVGIDFGLWVEMEMANPQARLVTQHPDWLLTDPHRRPHLQRGQYVLDLTNPAVQNFCIDAFDNIINQNPGISFVKWDCNSPMHNPYSAYLGKNQQHLWHDYTRGLYRIFEAATTRHPKLQMMLCSAGGGRTDYGAMKYFHEYWTSDNTTPTSRVFIQWGNSHIFPAKTHGSHVTHMGRQPFKFAFDVAMSGTLGMDADPTKMTDEEKAITTRALQAYKTKLRPVVQLGDLYRLVSPYETSRSVVSYVDAGGATRAAVFVYQVRDDAAGGLTIGLQGLDPELNYRIEEVNIDSPQAAACKENGRIISGRELIDKGLSFKCQKRFDSAAVYLEGVK